METKRFGPGEVIFRELSLGSEMFEIKSGLVGIFVGYGTEGETKLTELGAGRIFGELAAIDVEPRSATAVALEETETEVVTSADLMGYFAEKPEKILTILRGIGVRVRELTDDYTEVCDTIRELNECRRAGAEKSRGLLSRIWHFIDESTRLEPIAKQYEQPGKKVGRTGLYGGVRYRFV